MIRAAQRRRHAVPGARATPDRSHRLILASDVGPPCPSALLERGAFGHSTVRLPSVLVSADEGLVEVDGADSALATGLAGAGVRPLVVVGLASTLPGVSGCRAWRLGQPEHVRRVCDRAARRDRGPAPPPACRQHPGDLIPEGPRQPGRLGRRAHPPSRGDQRLAAVVVRPTCSLRPEAGRCRPCRRKRICRTQSVGLSPPDSSAGADFAGSSSRRIVSSISALRPLANAISVPMIANPAL